MADTKKVNEEGVVVDSNGFPEYGTPGYQFELQWHDAKVKDYLIVTGCKKISEIMNARAKGTTVYEIIDMYGGIDEVTAAYAGNENKAVYADVSNVPEFADDSAYDSIIQDLAKAVAAQQAKTAAEAAKQNEGQTDEMEGGKE